MTVSMLGDRIDAHLVLVGVRTGTKKRETLVDRVHRSGLRAHSLGMSLLAPRKDAYDLTTEEEEAEVRRPESGA